MIATLQQQSCKQQLISIGANQRAMTGLQSDTQFVKDLCEWAKMAPSALARAVGLTPTTILRPYNGTATTRLSQPTLDKLRDKYPDFPGWRKDGRGGLSPDIPLTRSADAGETAEIIQLDLSLPMGTGATIDEYVEEEPRIFDLAYLRAFTRTPPSRLRLARGVGDSMYPTLLAYDQVWIDSTQRALNQSDKIWAVSINGAAAIKRLRPLRGGKVLVISDNPAIENYEVDADELVIGGRIIRFARDV